MGPSAKIEKQLQQEVQQLMALAESEGRTNIPDGMEVPKEIALRQQHLAVLDEAKRTLAKRQVKRDIGKKPGGKDPEPPTSGPQDKDQIN